jgi:hypothetical protein
MLKLLAKDLFGLPRPQPKRKEGAMLLWLTLTVQLLCPLLWRPSVVLATTPEPSSLTLRNLLQLLLKSGLLQKPDLWYELRCSALYSRAIFVLQTLSCKNPTRFAMLLAAIMLLHHARAVLSPRT